MSKVHRYECPLRWSDMDAYGHVNNTVFLTYLEEARVDLLLNGVGEHGRSMLDTGVLVARHVIDYKVPLSFRTEPVTIEVWTAEVRAASFSVAYRVVDAGRDGADEVIYATAETRLVAYDLTAAAVRRLTDGERAFLTAYLH